MKTVLDVIYVASMLQELSPCAADRYSDALGLYYKGERQLAYETAIHSIRYSCGIYSPTYHDAMKVKP